MSLCDVTQAELELMSASSLFIDATVKTLVTPNSWVFQKDEYGPIDGIPVVRIYESSPVHAADEHYVEGIPSWSLTFFFDAAILPTCLPHWSS